MGSLQFIASANANSGNRASAFTFDNISTNFTDLILFASMRSTDGSQSSEVTLYFNNSQTANTYAIQSVSGLNVTVSRQSFSNTQLQAWINANSGSGCFGSPYIYIPNYRSTNWNKAVSIESNSTTTLANFNNYTISQAGEWLNTSAITRIDMYVTAGQIAQYSDIYLYGINWTP